MVVAEIPTLRIPLESLGQRIYRICIFISSLYFITNQGTNVAQWAQSQNINFIFIFLHNLTIFNKCLFDYFVNIPRFWDTITRYGTRIEFISSYRQYFKQIRDIMQHFVSTDVSIKQSQVHLNKISIEPNLIFHLWIFYHRP